MLGFSYLYRPSNPMLAAWGLTLTLNVPTVEAATLYDNLSALSADTHTVTAKARVAAAFCTDSASHSLGSVTLLLAGGSANVYICSGDENFGPKTRLATLTSPATPGSALQEMVFSTSGLTLTPNTLYWILLPVYTCCAVQFNG